jgi:hypothetical protein
MLSNEISGNGLRERVTACRKRLRVNRVTHHQSHTLSGATELSPAIAPAVSEFHDYLTEIPAASPILPGISQTHERNELEDREALRSMDGTEVGIT